jgi:hypothetical protein
LVQQAHDMPYNEVYKFHTFGMFLPKGEDLGGIVEQVVTQLNTKSFKFKRLAKND